MFLSKRIVTIAVAATIFSGMSSLSYASDGNLNFTGEITNNPCTVVGDSGANVNVMLGKVSQTSFANAGDEAAATSFALKLTNCSNVTSAQVSFDGASDAVNKSLIKLSAGADAATGVGIGIYEANGSTLIPLFSKSKEVAVKEGAAQFDFVAKYVATSKDVKAGSANGSATFTVAYK